MVCPSANPAAGDHGARQEFQSGLIYSAKNSQVTLTPQAPIRAELIGADACSALGIAARTSAPVLALCRELIEAGHDPATPLHVYRGDVLALIVRSIGEGAALEIGGDGIGFRRRAAPGTAPPARQNESAPRGVPGEAVA